MKSKLTHSHHVLNGSQVRSHSRGVVYANYLTNFREDNPPSGEPTKNELKRRAKAAEKERKAAEKAARLAEQEREKAEAEEVCLFLILKSQNHVLRSLDGPLLREKRDSISPKSFTVNCHSTSPNRVPASRDTRSRPSHPSWMGKRSSFVRAYTRFVAREIRYF